MTPRNEFEDKVLVFMARMDEHLRNQTEKCDLHGKMLNEQSERVKSLEDTREYARGVLKTIGVGVPAIGSVSWFIYRVWEILHKKV